MLATADGNVKETGYRAGFGNYVILSHRDGSESMYNHLQKSEARRGMFVRAGQEIARLGSTGRSTGPHLDYRLKQRGGDVDPMTALAGKVPLGTAFAKASSPSKAVASTMASRSTKPNVRVQNGVRIISPQQRVAMTGGFIQVR